MGLAGEMRESREVGTAYYFFFSFHLPFFRTPADGGATDVVAVEVDMIEYVTWKKTSSTWRFQESGLGGKKLEAKETSRQNGDRVFSLIISI